MPGYSGDAMWFFSRSTVVSTTRRSRALAIHPTAVFAGGGIGSWAAGWLADICGWSMPFIVFAVLGGAALIVAAAGAAAQATMEPAVADAYQKYRAAQDQIAAGNRHVGPEASWLPSFGDRGKVTKTTGAQLEKLTGRPPTAWTTQQHQVMAAQPYIPPPAPGKIVVVAPDGATAYLPAAQWPQAQREGYLQLPFTTAPGPAK